MRPALARIVLLGLPLTRIAVWAVALLLTALALALLVAAARQPRNSDITIAAISVLFGTGILSVGVMATALTWIVREIEVIIREIIKEE